MHYLVEARHFEPFCQPFHLNQLVNTPTHGDRALDLLFASSKVNWGLGCPIENHITHPHCEIWFHVIAKPKILSKGKRPVWLYGRANWDALNDALIYADLPDLVSSAANIEEAWINWKSVYLTAVEAFIPKKNVQWSRLDKGWFIPSLLVVFKERDTCFRRWRSNPTQENRAKLSTIRKRLRKLISVAKKDYYANQFASCAGDQGKFWKILNRLRGKSTAHGIPDLEDSNGDLIVPCVDKANLIADQYDSVFNRADGPRPPLTDIPIDYEWLCDENWVFEQLISLDTKKSGGIDGISGQMLVKTAAAIAPSVALLINKSLVEGLLPSEWKHTIVCPVAKVKNSSKPVDYRPISLLCIISKLCERCVLRKLGPLIDTKLPNLQYGFRRCRSTEDALALMEHKVVSMFNDCNGLTKVVGVFFDLSKAFDTVPIGRLLTTLESVFEIPPGVLNWLHSFLINRIHQVRVDGSLSTVRDVISGVPQGSILGPILFNAYVAPVQQLLFSNSAVVIGYADDLVYLKKAQTAAEQAAIIQDINDISNCYHNLDLKLNVNKTKYMLFTLSDLYPKPELELPPSISGQQIGQVESYKYLGVWLDPKLSWSEHCAKTTLKCKRAIGAYSRTCRRFVPQFAFRKLYCHTILPSLLYSIPVLWPIYEKDQRKFESVHKYAAKLATNNFISSYDCLRSQLGWHSIDRIAAERRLLLLYKYHQGLRYLPNDVIKPKEPLLSTRANHNNSQQYVLPNVTRDRCNKTFFVRAINVWNSLPDSVIDLDLFHFKKAVRHRQ